MKAKKASARKAAKTRSTVLAAPAAPTAEGRDVLNMEEAVALLKTTRPTFYRWLREGKIKAYKAGRQWRFERQDIDRFLKGQEPRISTTISPAPLIAELEAKFAALGRKPGPRRFPDDAVAEAVHQIIRLAFQQRVTDTHLAPHQDELGACALLRFRIDGVLHSVARIDSRLLSALIERWKTYGAMNTKETRVPQDGQCIMDLDGRKIGMFLSTMPTQTGESITMRVLDYESPQVTFHLDNLAYSPEDLKRIKEAVHCPFGLVLANGPTGCGKTTTLYSCLSALAGPERKIMTVEDPVEVALPWTLQTHIDPAAGVTFARVIAGMLRSAPNVIMVGEIRDAEVANLCVQVALTGHLVFTTLHANDSAQALRRLVEMGLPAAVLADATRLVVSQRLARRLCPHCSKPARLTAEEESLVAEVSVRGGLSIQDLPREFRQPVGCAKCGHLGHSGRIVLAETLKMASPLGKALRENATVEELRRVAVQGGMTTMPADGVRKAAAGLTTLREVQACFGPAMLA
jgi:general secretion pathway protein E